MAVTGVRPHNTALIPLLSSRQCEQNKAMPADRGAAESRAHHGLMPAHTTCCARAPAQLACSETRMIDNTSQRKVQGQPASDHPARAFWPQARPRVGAHVKSWACASVAMLPPSKPAQPPWSFGSPRNALAAAAPPQMFLLACMAGVILMALPSEGEGTHCSVWLGLCMTAPALTPGPAQAPRLGRVSPYNLLCASIGMMARNP